MDVFEVTVTFGRKRQPRDYENANAEITYKASLNEGDDVAACTDELTRTAQKVVYEALDMQTAADRVAKGGSTGKTAAQDREDSAEAGETKPASGSKGGRPKGSKNKPKAETESKDDDLPADEPKADTKKAETEAKADAASDDLPDDSGGESKAETKSKGNASNDDLPDDDGESKGGGNISENPEDRKNPDDDLPADESDDGPGDDEDMSASDLQSFITTAISKGVDGDKERKVKLDNVKEILASFGASRTTDIKPGDRAKVKKAIEDIAGI